MQCPFGRCFAAPLEPARRPIARAFATAAVQVLRALLFRSPRARPEMDSAVESAEPSVFPSREIEPNAGPVMARTPRTLAGAAYPPIRADGSCVAARSGEGGQIER